MCWYLLYIYMYICTSYIYICVCMKTYLYAHTCLHTFVQCMHTHKWGHALYIYTHICVSVYTHTHTHTHTHTLVYIYTGMYIYTILCTGNSWDYYGNQCLLIIHSFLSIVICNSPSSLENFKVLEMSVYNFLILFS